MPDPTSPIPPPPETAPDSPPDSPALGASADASLSEALERLAAGWDPQSTPLDGEHDRAVRRHLEAFAALPEMLDPVEPRASLRDAVLAATRPGRDLQAARSPRRWAIAAGLAACLFGAGWMLGTMTVGAPAETMVHSTTSPSAATPSAATPSAATPSTAISGRSATGSSEAQLATLRERLATSERRLRMITLEARIAYPMRSVGEPGVDGVIYVCGAHQRWVLALRGLEPAPVGEEYRLWFLTEDGPVDGGVVSLEESGEAGMDALSMPDGTRGFRVTLEPTGARRAVPSDHTVLLADRPVTL